MIPGLFARIGLPGRAARTSGVAKLSRVRSARSAVASGVFFVLAAMVGLSAALETVKPDWRDPEYGHRLARLRELERESPGRPLVLILGTSRAQNAVDPSRMGFADEPGSPRVFNFGQSATPALKVLLTYQRLRDAGIRPSAVVVEVLPVWMVNDGPAEAQFVALTPRLSAGDLQRLAPYSVRPSRLWTRWLADRAAPWSSHRVSLLSHWAPRWLPWGERIDPQWEGMERDGFVPYPPQFSTPAFRIAATEHARKEHEGSLDGYRFGEVSVRALRDLAARCRAEGIPLAIVEPPVSETFRCWFRPGVWASGTERLRALAGELDAAYFPPPEVVPEADFIDGHHLLRPAAERYSRWLAETHLKPWLAAKGVATR